MRVFVPVPDDWDGGPTYRGEPLVAYRYGMTVWREPVPPPAAAATPQAAVPTPAGSDERQPPISEAA